MPCLPRCLKKFVPGKFLRTLSIRTISASASGTSVHLLLVPRKPIPRLSLADEGDAALLGHMMLAAGKIARSLGIDESGFRLVINNGPDAGEAVPHLHMHILAGRKLEWPPG